MTRIIGTLFVGILIISGACAGPVPAVPPAATATATPAPTVSVVTTPIPTAPTPIPPEPTPPVAATPPPEPKTPATVQGYDEVWVTVPGKEFRPSTLTVLAGTKVNWISTDGEPETIHHTITSTTGLFEGDITHGGGPFSYTFTERGTFTYYCKNFAGMTGTVIVK